jgi:hypothetical protein
MVRALHWLRDTMTSGDNDLWLRRLTALLHNPVHGAKLRGDLADGMSTLPSWMQELLRPLVFNEARDA